MSLYYLLRYVLSAGTQWKSPSGELYCDRQFILDFCNKVQGWSHDVLDVAARFHAKSLIKTTALPIQQILNDPEVTIAIISNTLGQARDFLFQLKSEIESNALLRTLSYDWSLGGQIFWENPQKEAPRWSLLEGLVTNRKSKPKESTLEAIGLLEGIKPGPHFKVLNYDDAVTPESVSTSDQIEKTTKAWSMSLNYGQPGTQRIYTGTFYSYGDSYHEIMRRGVELRLQPAFEIKELVTDPDSGHIKKLDWHMDKPVLYTKEELDSVVGGMRPREYGTQILCLDGAAPILMADWSEKKISDVSAGDMVMGYGPLGRKNRLGHDAPEVVPTRVKAVMRRRAVLVRYTTESGREVICTEGHKWYTGRWDSTEERNGKLTKRNRYAPLVEPEKHKGLHSLRSVYEPAGDYDERAAAWLGGFYDGEGSFTGSMVHFSQSDKYPEILNRLESTLDTLGFKWEVDRRDRNPEWFVSNDYRILGGRSARARFLQMCKPSKDERLRKSLFRSYGFNKEKVVKAEVLHGGEETDVWNIATDTGNYVAYGFASKNCFPQAGEEQGFDEDWILYYKNAPLDEGKGKNIYILVDPAAAKKKDSSYTVMWVVGAGSDKNYYLLDGIRDRLNLGEKANALFALHRRWDPYDVRYEQYALQADIQHMKDRMERESYRFRIREVGGHVAKDDRIARLVPLFSAGRFFLPRSLHKTRIDGTRYDLVAEFIGQEYIRWPTCETKDMLDALARIDEPDMPITWPATDAKKPERYKDGRHGATASWMVA